MISWACCKPSAILVDVIQKAPSSAYNEYLTFEGQSLNIEFTTIEKRVGLITDPCGTPFDVVNVDEKLFWILTLKDLEFKNDWMKTARLPLIFRSRNISISPLCQTESKALDISRNTAIQTSLLLSALLASFCSAVSGSSVECDILNPLW